MSEAELLAFERASVGIKVNGKAALGILSFPKHGRPCVTSFCLLDSKEACPLIRHELSGAEVAAMTIEDTHHLASEISIKSPSSAFRISAIDRLVLGQGVAGAGQDGLEPNINR